MDTCLLCWLGGVPVVRIAGSWHCCGGNSARSMVCMQAEQALCTCGLSPALWTCAHTPMHMRPPRTSVLHIPVGPQ